MSVDYSSEHVHAHIQTVLRDCDGVYSRERIDRPSDFDHMSGYMFRCYVIGSNVRTWEPGGTLTVEFEEHVRWYAKTDEGYEHIDIVFCDDDCENVNSFRDHSAEQAGY